MQKKTLVVGKERVCVAQMSQVYHQCQQMCGWSKLEVTYHLEIMPLGEIPTHGPTIYLVFHQWTSQLTLKTVP